jgi:methionine aminopeptidase
MSRIFEALQHAQQMRTEKGQSNAQSETVIDAPDRRRSRRWTFDIPVYVYGHGIGRETFHEEAHTLNVNENGALLLLSVPVRKGQTILLTNQITQQEMGCRVVRLGKQYSRTIETGVAFTEANPDFWKVRPLPKDDPAA